MVWDAWNRTNTRRKALAKRRKRKADKILEKQKAAREVELREARKKHLHELDIPGSSVYNESDSFENKLSQAW